MGAKQQGKQFELQDVYKNAQNKTNESKLKMLGIHKASVVSQQTVIYNTNNTELKSDASLSKLPQPTSLGEI